MGQGNIFAPVCHSDSRGGGSATVHSGIPPPPEGPGTPWEQTPPPGADTPWSRHAPCAVHAGRYGQQAGGMHPTGMQSCYRLQTKLQEGYVFTGVCDSVNSGVSLPGRPPSARETPPARKTPPCQVDPPARETPLPRRPPGNKRAVRILLECILVFLFL